jgi:ribosomal protein L37AE/L43A
MRKLKVESDKITIKLPAPHECPACKRTGFYEKPKINCYYCPHCWNLFGEIYGDPRQKIRLAM